MHNTLNSANILIEAGFSDPQAQAMVTVMTDNLATKEDIEALGGDMQKMETSLRRDMGTLRSDMKEDMGTLRLATKEDIEALRLATKGDIEALGGDMQKMETSLRRDMGTLRSDMKEDMGTLRSDMKEDMGILRSDMKEDMGILKEDIGTIHKEIQEIKVSNNGQFVFIKWIGGIIAGGMILLALQMFNTHKAIRSVAPSSITSTAVVPIASSTPPSFPRRLQPR